MSAWQRKARLIIMIGVVGFGIAVAVAFRPRAPEPAAPSTPSPTDPNALIEAASPRTLRVNRNQQEVLTEYEKLVTYQDGTTRMLGVKVTTTRAGGRTFTLTAREGRAGQNESQLEVLGDVQMVASDGLLVAAERATYAEQDGIVRAPGPVKFSRGRMRGTGIGLTYDKARDVATIHEQVAVHVRPGAADTGGTDITASFAELNRPENTIRFDGGVKTVRSLQTIEAATALARLSPDDERLERVELRGQARITNVPGRAGGVESLSGTDIDVTYGADGAAIERAVIMGGGVIRLAGERKSPAAPQDRVGRPQPPAEAGGGRQISAQHIDVSLAAEGTTPTALSARENVQVVLPGEPAGAARTVTAQTLEASGDESKGLTRARFSGDVRFRERGPGLERTARAATLDAALGPGFGSLEDTTFRGGVRFEQDGLSASAAAVRYVLGAGTLELTGSEPAAPTPRVVNDRLAVDALRISVVLEGPKLAASGAVRSTVRPPDGAEKQDRSQGQGPAKLPSMFDDEQPVHVTANELSYDGNTGAAVYTGAARLSQGDTSIKADSLTLDEKTGDLTATGSVATAGVLLQGPKEPDTNEPGKKERVTTLASASELSYTETLRRATYTGDAHVSGPQGDLTAARIELFLMAGGDELERVEAYDGVTLRERDRVTTGARMTYFGADERYLVTGAPVKIVNECGAETSGRTLTFFRSADRIVIDGTEQRTQTRGGSNCR